MESLNFLLIVVLGIVVLSLRSRIAKLESRSDTSSPPLVEASQQTASQPVASSMQAAPVVPVMMPIRQQMVQSEPSFDVVAWVKKDWLLKLGGLFVLSACGWFVSYAMIEGWIGEFGRIALGLLLGSGVMVLGWFRIQTYRDQGALFLALGATIDLLTIYAARSLYDIFTPLTALIVMFAVSAFVSYVSAVYKHKNLAVAGLLLSGVAPLLTHSPVADLFGLYSYLLVVILGALVVVFHTGYRELTSAAFFVFAFYSVPQFITGAAFGGDDRMLMFGFAFGTVFFLANIIGMVRRGAVAISHDTLLAAGNAVLLLLFINSFVAEEWKSMVTIAWTLVFVVGSFMALRLTRAREPFFIYAAVSVGYLVAATAFTLSGPVLTMAYCVEVVMIVFISQKLFTQPVFVEYASLLFVLPMVLSIGSLTSPAWATGIFHNDMLVLVTLGLALAAVGLLLMGRISDKTSQMSSSHWQLIFGSLYGYALVWLLLHALLGSDDATMVSLVVYIFCGLAAYMAGLFVNAKSLRVYGAAVLLCTVARLLLVDVWAMEMPARIITFFSIGVLLLSTAFIRTRNITITGI
jgi:hypothetical protein